MNYLKYELQHPWAVVVASAAGPLSAPVSVAFAVAVAGFAVLRGVMAVAPAVDTVPAVNVAASAPVAVKAAEFGSHFAYVAVAAEVAVEAAAAYPAVLHGKNIEFVSTAGLAAAGVVVDWRVVGDDTDAAGVGKTAAFVPAVASVPAAAAAHSPEYEPNGVKILA
jgi:hypothetical protein